MKTPGGINELFFAAHWRCGLFLHHVVDFHIRVRLVRVLSVFVFRHCLVAAGRVPELKCPELVPDANVGHHGAHAHSYSQPRTDERERVGKAA